MELQHDRPLCSTDKERPVFPRSHLLASAGARRPVMRGSTRTWSWLSRAAAQLRSQMVGPIAARPPWFSVDAHGKAAKWRRRQDPTTGHGWIWRAVERGDATSRRCPTCRSRFRRACRGSGSASTCATRFAGRRERIELAARFFPGEISPGETRTPRGVMRKIPFCKFFLW